jgi:hypothetical protein
MSETSTLIGYSGRTIDRDELVLGANTNEQDGSVRSCKFGFDSRPALHLPE